MMTVPSYTDSQTGYIYKMIVDEVLKTVRRDIREEIDDHAINLLKINWERRLNAVIIRSKESAIYSNFKQDKNTVSASMVYAATTLNQPQKLYPLYYSLSTTGSDVRQQLPNSQTVPTSTLTAPPASFINKAEIHAPEKRKIVETSNPPPHIIETPKEGNVVPVSVDTNPLDSDLSEPPSKKQRVNRIVQLDGGVDDLTDTEDEDIYSEEDDTAEGKEKIKEKRYKVDDDFAEIDNEGNLLIFDEPESDVRRSELIVDNEPLNRDDDISDDDPIANDTDNIMICRFEKLIRRKSLWKVELRHGIATINGVDLVFNKALGDIVF